MSTPVVFLIKAKSEQAFGPPEGSVGWEYLQLERGSISQPAVGGRRLPSGLALPAQGTPAVQLCVVQSFQPVRVSCMDGVEHSC